MKVEICEVGPRDGLQNEAQVVAPELRADLVTRLAETGVGVVEAVSFVRDDVLPQMAGAEEVLARVTRDGGARLAGLVLNERGYERFAAAPLDELHFTLGATEGFNRRNANASVEESLTAFAGIAERNARERTVVASISVSFGCPFEGEVDPYRVLRIAERLGASGADAVVLADTIGVAVPRQVRSLVRQAAQLLPRVGAHFHNTRNTGFANALAAVEEGATILDASVGGLGGCPFAPKATGNIATEDLVYMLHGEGIETGVELGSLIGVAEWLEGVLGRPLPGQVYRAGAFAPVSG